MPDTREEILTRLVVIAAEVPGIVMAAGVAVTDDGDPQCFST